ncbi:S4 domain-containing protein [Pseudoroseomonas wenyumeiae]
MADTEDRDWQRLDKWLWCARVAKTRAECSRFVERGTVRLNRQPVDKPHAKLRPGMC